MLTAKSPHEDGFYRETCSLNCFRNRELERVFGVLGGKRAAALKMNYYDYSMTVKYCSVELFYEQYAETRSILGIKDTIIIEKEFDSVWDLYNHIGYDRKKKRYI